MRQNIKEGLEGRPASWYSDIFDHVFSGLDREEANKSKVADEKKQDAKDADPLSE